MAVVAVEYPVVTMILLPEMKAPVVVVGATQLEPTDLVSLFVTVPTTAGGFEPFLMNPIL